MKQRYQGHVDLISGEIDEDLQAYLCNSEQVVSGLRAAVRLGDEGQVLGAVGVLVQALPETDPAMVAACIARLENGALRKLLAHNPDHDQLAALALGVEANELRLGMSAEIPVSFHCPCGPEQARRVLSTLGAEDLLALADEQAITDIRCNFCGRNTQVPAADLREISAAILRRTN
jgi:molecular chaperone Hsp33